MATTKHATEPKTPHQPAEGITIIGCGNMGSAIAERLSTLEKIYLYDHNLSKIQLLAQKGYGLALDHLEEGIRQSTLIILAIKPQSLKESYQSIQKYLTKGHTLISLLACTTLEQLKTYFPNCHLIRMMPNIAVVCGESMSAFCSEPQERDSIEKQLGHRLDLLGKSIWLPENKIDAFTALAGSGPAFLFALTEAMIDAGIAMGFSARESQEIIYQMIHGSTALMKASGAHPAELKWQVASPAGTTIAGLVAFEENALRSGIIKTFLAAHQRTKEMRSTHS